MGIPAVLGANRARETVHETDEKLCGLLYRICRPIRAITDDILHRKRSKMCETKRHQLSTSASHVASTIPYNPEPEAAHHDVKSTLFFTIASCVSMGTHHGRSSPLPAQRQSIRSRYSRLKVYIVRLLHSKSIAHGQAGIPQLACLRSVSRQATVTVVIFFSLRHLRDVHVRSRNFRQWL